MTDIANLEIRIKSTDAKKAEKSLDGLAKKGGKAEKAVGKYGKEAKKADKATDGMSAALKRAAGRQDALARSTKKSSGALSTFGGAISKAVLPLVALSTATAGLMEIVRVTREFDILNAQLITATGSAEAANLAFKELQEFAATTPYDLQQVTSAFVQLKNLGLDPSEAALRSYGNTASAMGKSLKQLIEAVADASTGEFERLKEFGIRSRKYGDEIQFTFRGLTKTVAFESQAIQGYLRDLGDVEFAGAMERQMDTLNGAISNLGDNWEAFVLNISKSGIGDALKEQVGAVNDFMSELNAGLESSLIEKQHLYDADLLSFFDYVTSSGKERKKLVDDAQQKYDELHNSHAVHNRNVQTLLDRENEVQANANASLVALYANKSADLATGVAVYEGILAASIARQAALLGQMEMGPPSDLAAPGSASYEPPKAANLYGGFKADLDRRYKLRTTYDKDVRELESKRHTFEKGQYVELIKLTKQRLDADLSAEDARDARAAKRAAGPAAPRATGGSRSSVGSASTAPSATDRMQEQQERELDMLRDSLRTREEMIEDSYAKQMEIAATAGEDRTELELELTQRRNAELADLEMARVEMISHAGQDLFGSLADAAATFAGEQSDAYRVLFAASKAFAIAEAMIAMQVAISKALALGFPANIPHMAAAASAGASIISTITSTQYSGAYDKGGEIKAGEYGLVGEKGIEIVEGKARAVSGSSVSAISNDFSRLSNASNESDNSIKKSTSNVSSIFNATSNSSGDEITSISPQESVVVGVNGPQLIEGPVRVVGREDTQKIATEISNNSTSSAASNEANNVVNIGGNDSAVNSNIENAGAVNSNSAVSSISSVASNVRNNESLTANATTKNIGDSVSNVSSIFNSKLDGESTSNINKIMNSYSYGGDNSEIDSSAINEGNKTTINGGAISNIRNIRSSADSDSESSATSLINNLGSNTINESNQSATNNVASIFKEKKYAGAFDLGGTIPAGELGMVNEKGFELIEGPAKVTGREDTARMFQQLTDAVNGLQQPSQNVRIINVQGESAEDYLGSDPGERKIINIWRRNRSALRGMVA